MKALRVLGLLALTLQGCASWKVKSGIEDVGWKDDGHLAWWSDSLPRVLMLPRVCAGPVPEFRIPGPSPSVYLRLDLARRSAIFHDDSLSCSEATRDAVDSLRLVVADRDIPLGLADSVVLQGNLAPDGTLRREQFLRGEKYSGWYSLGKEGYYSDNTCPTGSWCLREGARIQYRTNGRMVSLQVQERLHPEDSPWARREKANRSVAYLFTVPIDIALSPVYAVGFVFLWWALRDYHPYH